MATQVYACIVPEKDQKNSVNLGLNYALDHRSEWVSVPQGLSVLIVPGFTKGIDHIVVNNKAYIIWKDYAMPNEDIFLMLCRESLAGCDIVDKDYDKHYWLQDYSAEEDMTLPKKNNETPEPSPEPGPDPEPDPEP